MIKYIFLINAIFASSLGFSQVGINTENPQGIFHIDGAKDNASIGAPTALQQVNDIYVDSVGRLGVGTTSPTNKVEINSGTPNASGLTFSQFNSASPISSGKSIGVDTNGKVVTLIKPTRTRLNGAAVATVASSVANGTQYNFVNITIPKAGTYLVSYITRGGCSGANYISSFLSTGLTPDTVVPNSEILIALPGGGVNATFASATGTNSMIVTISAPTTYYVGAKGTNNTCAVLSDTYGRTSINYVEIN